MAAEKAIQMLESALHSFKVGDENASTTLLQALKSLGIELSNDTITMGDISDAAGIAIRRNIQMIVNQAVLPKDLQDKLSQLLDKLARLNRKISHRHIRIFLSSPGDLVDERALAMRVIDEIPYDPLLRGRVSIDTVAWDKAGGSTPMLATMTPQEAINQGLPMPSECDIVVVLFWTRMGTALPTEYTKPEAYRFSIGGKWQEDRYFSGTEWEYVDAMEAAKKKGKPFVIIYRCTEPPSITLNDPNLDTKREQWQLVESFFSTFTQPDGVIRQGVNFYKSPSDFEQQLGIHLRDLIARLFVKLEQEEQEQQTYIENLGESSEPIFWEGSPFPGLRAFGPEESPIFYGRGLETDELVAHFKKQSFLAVIGASGSGKSSLVGAGLLPRLLNNAIPGSQDWVILRFTPDELGGGTLSQRLRRFYVKHH